MLFPFPATADHTVDLQDTASDTKRLGIAIPERSRDRLRCLAELHHRTLSGEIAWLIDAAYRDERELAEIA